MTSAALTPCRRAITKRSSGIARRRNVRDCVAEMTVRRKATSARHFAALSLVGESAGRPLEYYDNNITGAISLVSAVRRCGISRMMFSSICATCIPDQLPLEDSHATQPINVYGCAWPARRCRRRGTRPGRRPAVSVRSRRMRQARVGPDPRRGATSAASPTRPQNPHRSNLFSEAVRPATPSREPAINFCAVGNKQQLNFISDGSSA